MVIVYSVNPSDFGINSLVLSSALHELLDMKIKKYLHIRMVIRTNL